MNITRRLLLVSCLYKEHNPFIIYILRLQARHRDLLTQSLLYIGLLRANLCSSYHTATPMVGARSRPTTQVYRIASITRRPSPEWLIATIHLVGEKLRRS